MSSPPPEPSDGDATHRQEAEPPAANDVLPPVQAPGAGFFMQLFFVPLIIVAILFAVCGMFSWLAHMGSRPEQLVQDFEQLNYATWQKALTLANILRAPTNDALRRDSELAQRLAAVLEREIDTGDLTEEHLRFRIYLCRALGEFYVVDGLPTLLRAASDARSIDQWQVRRAALEAIGYLTDHVGASKIEENERLLPVLRQIAEEPGNGPQEPEPRAKLRANTAFVLGLLESDESLQPLVVLLSDPDTLVRYNAAAGLARRGDPRAVPQLRQMLDPDNHELLATTGRENSKTDTDESATEWNRRLVVSNALRAARQLAEKNSSSDLSSLHAALDRLQRTDLRGALRAEADELSRVLDRRPPPSDEL